MLNLLFKDIRLMGLKIIWLALALTGIIITVSVVTSHEFVKLITMPILFMLIGFQSIFHLEQINQYHFTENSLPVSRIKVVLKNYILMFLLWSMGILLALALNCFQQLIDFPYVETNIYETVINSFWLNNFFFAVVLLYYSEFGKYRQALYMAIFCIVVALSILTVNEMYYQEITGDSIHFGISYVLTAIGAALLTSALLVLLKRDIHLSFKNRINKIISSAILIFSLIPGYALIMNFFNLSNIHSLQRALDKNVLKKPVEAAAQISNFYVNSGILLVLFLASFMLVIFYLRNKLLALTTELKIIILLYIAMFGYIVTMRTTNLQETLWTMSLYTIILAIPTAVHFYKNREF